MTPPTRRILVTTTLVALTLAFGSTSLRAHDMWIEPATFTPEAGELVSVKLRVGQGLLGDPIPRDPALIKDFIVEDAEGRKPVVGRAGSDPAGVVRASVPGVMVLGYQSHPSLVTLSADKFRDYLTEEGLEAIAARRARLGQTGPVRERFIRCAKSLVRSGTPAGDKADRSLGFALELTVERMPSKAGTARELPLRLVHEQRPLAGALVVAINRTYPAEKVSARTGKDGRVRLRLPRSGMWLVKAVHMTEAPDGSGADWQSYWASVTFELPEPAHTGHAS